VRFNQDQSGIVAMASVEGECVDMAQAVTVTDAVEEWLTQLSACMKVTLRQQLAGVASMSDPFQQAPSQVLGLHHAAFFTERWASNMLILKASAALCCVVLHGATLCCVVLRCDALHCAVLRCAVLCCAVLCCAVLCCVVLCCAVLSCAVLCCALLCCAPLRCAALRCAVLCCAVLCCAVLSCMHTCTNHHAHVRT
jgi:Dynein heavy chain, N-terminal region 2